MTPAQIADVQQSFAQLRPQADTVAARFYQRLLTLDPSVRPLFPDDLTAQGRKLMDMLGLVVHGLPRVDTVLPAVQAPAAAMCSTGSRPSTTRPWGRRSSGPEQELGRPGRGREAWTTAYTVLAELMTAAAGEPSSPAQHPHKGSAPGSPKITKSPPPLRPWGIEPTREDLSSAMTPCVAPRLTPHVRRER